jgi:hypothetical protein
MRAPNDLRGLKPVDTFAGNSTRRGGMMPELVGGYVRSSDQPLRRIDIRLVRCGEQGG